MFNYQGILTPNFESLPKPFENYFVFIGDSNQFNWKTHLRNDEMEQATRFFKAEDQRNFIARRSVLNSMLQKFLNTDFTEIYITKNKFGKPSLLNSNFNFNCSHTSNFFAIAFGPTELGIDIEEIRDAKPYLEVAEKYFHPNEKNEILNSNNQETFFKVWTKKEAIIKSQGNGINEQMINIDTTKPINNLIVETITHDNIMLSIAYQQSTEKKITLYTQ